MDIYAENSPIRR